MFSSIGVEPLEGILVHLYMKLGFLGIVTQHPSRHLQQSLVSLGNNRAPYSPMGATIELDGTAMASFPKWKKDLA